MVAALVLIRAEGENSVTLSTEGTLIYRKNFDIKAKAINHNTMCNLLIFYYFWYFLCSFDSLSECKKSQKT